MQSPDITTIHNPPPLIETTFKLTRHFDAFFNNINPSQTWRSKAASEYNSIKTILEDDPFLKKNLGIQCRVQGSYDRHTAIHSINDLDIVAFCTSLRYPPTLSLFERTDQNWTRDRIFHAIEAVLANDFRYRNALITSTANSMCVKLGLSIKAEILPVVPQTGQVDCLAEPFYLWRPSKQIWELGYAQSHQAALSNKNASAHQLLSQAGQKTFCGTNGNFIPAVKIFKHLCKIHGLKIVSFHLECLLYSILDIAYWGNPSSYIPQLLFYIAHKDPLEWYRQKLPTPCGDRDIFSSSEWSLDNWLSFHNACKQWQEKAMTASQAYTEKYAIETWQSLLGPAWFPTSPSL